MEFSEFRDEIYSKWQKNLLKIAWIGFFFILISELLIFYIYIKTDFIFYSPLDYFLLRIALPSGLNLVSSIIATRIYFSNRYTIKQKNLGVTAGIFVLASVVAIFHNYYNFLLVTIGIPIILSGVFGDKKLVKINFYACLVTFAIASLTLFFDITRPNIIDYFITILCTFLFVFFINMIANAFVNYQSRQIDFIYSIIKKQNELLQEIKIDPLTKIYNRASLCGAAPSFIRKFQKNLFLPHLVLLDIDDFKKINDTFGHINGDKVLVSLASIIKTNMKGIRRAFRYGGEEFVLLFENEPTELVYDITDQIRKDFESKVFDFSDEHFTLSGGISKLQKGWDDTTWFNCADNAMYKAKKSGKNKIITAEENSW